MLVPPSATSPSLRSSSVNVSVEGGSSSSSSSSSRAGCCSSVTPLRLGAIVICAVTILLLYFNVRDMSGFGAMANHPLLANTHCPASCFHLRDSSQATSSAALNPSLYFSNLTCPSQPPSPSNSSHLQFRCSCGVLSGDKSRLSLEGLPGMYVIGHSSMSWAAWESSRPTFAQPFTRTSLYRTFVRERSLSFMSESARARTAAEVTAKPAPGQIDTCSCDTSAAFALVSTPSDQESDPQWQRLFTMIYRLRYVGLRHDILVILPAKDGTTIPGPSDPAAWAALADKVLPPRVAKLLLSRVPGVHLVLVQPLKPPSTVRFVGNPSYVFSWQKLWMWRMTRYSRVVYLDLDVVVLSDPSTLTMTAPYPLEFASVPMGCDHVEYPGNINGGIMVLTPSVRIFDELMELAATESPTGWGYSEQELLQVYYVYLKPHLFASLSLHWQIPIRGFGPHMILGSDKHWYFPGITLRDLAETQFVSIHFVCGTTKPWDQEAWDEEGGNNLFNVFANVWQQHRRHMRKELAIDG